MTPRTPLGDDRAVHDAGGLRGARTSAVSAYQPFPAATPGYPPSAASDPTAVMGRRIGAVVVDFLLYMLIMAFVGPTPLSPLAEYYDTSGTDDACTVLQEDFDAVGCLEFGDRAYVTEAGDVAIQLVVWLAVVLLYSALQGAKGITPGKALFGVKVVDEQGASPGFGKSILRTILWVVDSAPWCLPLVGFITGLSTKGHRRVGDMAAKTFVVGKQHSGPVAVPGMTTAATGGYPGAAGPYGAPQGWGPPPGGPPTGQPPGWGAPGQPQQAQPPGAWTGQPSGGFPPPGGPGAPSGEHPPTALSGEQRPAPPAGAPGATPSTGRPPGDQPPDQASAPGSRSVSDAGPAATAPSAGPGGSEQPPGVQPPQAAAGPAAQPAPSGYEPQWDAARGTYIVWDPNRSKWLGWDEGAREWKPL